MLVENYKLENLLNAVKNIEKSENLGTSTVLQLAKLAKKLSDLLLPYMQVRKDFVIKNTIKDEKTGQLVPKDLIEYQSTIEKLGFDKTELDIDSFELSLPKDSNIMSIDAMQRFIDVFGDNFVCVESD
jgi:hypothetical protein